MDNDKNPRARVRGIFTVGRLRGRWTRRLRSLAALRADHENAAAAESAWRPIGVRASVRGLEQARPLPLPQPPPLRGFRSAAGHESLTKGHERLVAPKDRERALVCWCKANGPFLASSSFVTFRVPREAPIAAFLSNPSASCPFEDCPLASDRASLDGHLIH